MGEADDDADGFRVVQTRGHPSCSCQPRWSYVWNLVVHARLEGETVEPPRTTLLAEHQAGFCDNRGRRNSGESANQVLLLISLQAEVLVPLLQRHARLLQWGDGCGWLPKGIQGGRMEEAVGVLGGEGEAIFMISVLTRRGDEDRRQLLRSGSDTSVIEKLVHAAST